MRGCKVISERTGAMRWALDFARETIVDGCDPGYKEEEEQQRQAENERKYREETEDREPPPEGEDMPDASAEPSSFRREDASMDQDDDEHMLIR